MARMAFTIGSTRIPGLRHLHTDGIKSPEHLSMIVDCAAKLGFPTETLVVKACLENEARTDIIDLEGHHELNSPGDLISTTLVEPFDADAANELIRFILGFAGVTVELEHVIGQVKPEGSSWHDWQSVEPVRFDFADLGPIAPAHYPLEYHLALDPADGEPKLDQLMDQTLASKIMVGTWYNFGGSRIRSNRFAPTDRIRELVESDYFRFRALCEGNYRGETRVVEEYVLGIWTSPRQ